MAKDRSKPLRVKWHPINTHNVEAEQAARREMLYHMLHAQSRLVRAGKDSAMPHFIAVVKALEESFSFEFVPLED